MPKDEIQVQIRERDDQDAEYNRPAIALPEENEDSEQDDEESSEEEESSDEEEDEDASLLTPALDSQILRTIAAIQTQDPSVYDSSKKFFDKNDLSQAQQELLEKKQAQAKKEGKKYTLKDYEREVLLEHGGHIQDEQVPVQKTHYQEQRDLKNAFLSAAGGADDDSEEEEDGLGGGLLEKRVKSKEEEEAEDEAYRKFMLQNIAADEASSKAFKDWNENYKENPNVTKEDAFLIDYVLNRGWMEKPSDKKQQQQQYDIDQDEEHLDEIDRFESKYNFRFEEEGGTNIVSHARNIEESVRKKKDKRQKERERKKARKEAALREKAEEIARVRNQKMKEIRERLREIQEITGNSTVGLDKIDLDGDFDPAKYDEQMSKIFSEEYYEGEQDNVKPSWEDDIDTAMYEKEEEEDDIMMDADYMPGGEHYQESKKRKRGSEVQQEQAEVKQKAKELLEDIYSLNFEDIIGGDLPTRYKYRKTEPENYGLTAEEILLADDAELNKYVGLKMMAPYRNPKKHEKDKHQFEKQRYARYKNFRKHYDEKLKAIDPKAGSSDHKKYYKPEGEKKKQLRKRRGKKKKATVTEEA
ncbi:KRI1-like family C-terminal-domain-containing protein [Fennellomyces sp. T-0311]|nr:KRI1-like family C-terminal-domain-containing protein [Fennellomyces sp. T-0311]